MQGAVNAWLRTADVRMDVGVWHMYLRLKNLHGGLQQSGLCKDGVLSSPSIGDDMENRTVELADLDDMFEVAIERKVEEVTDSLSSFCATLLDIETWDIVGDLVDGREEVRG